MEINKSANFKTLDEITKYIDRIKKIAGLIRYNMSGAYDPKTKQENYRLDWIVEEE